MTEGLYPYAGSSGWSGSDTSRERAQHDDRQGITRDRHDKLMAYMPSRSPDGTTWFELADDLGWHHGEASGALTRAHRIGALLRTTDRRGTGKQSLVYVLPEAGERSHTPYRSRSAAKLARETLEFLDDDDVEGARQFLIEFLSAPAIVTPYGPVIPFPDSTGETGRPRPRFHRGPPRRVARANVSVHDERWIVSGRVVRPRRQRPASGSTGSHWD